MNGRITSEMPNSSQNIFYLRLLNPCDLWLWWHVILHEVCDQRFMVLILSKSRALSARRSRGSEWRGAERGTDETKSQYFPLNFSYCPFVTVEFIISIVLNCRIWLQMFLGNFHTVAIIYFLNVNTFSRPTSNTSAILKASSSEGLYLFASRALIVCRVTPTRLASSAWVISP